MFVAYRLFVGMAAAVVAMSTAAEAGLFTLETALQGANTPQVSVRGAEVITAEQYAEVEREATATLAFPRTVYNRVVVDPVTKEPRVPVPSYSNEFITVMTLHSKDEAGANIYRLRPFLYRGLFGKIAFEDDTEPPAFPRTVFVHVAEGTGGLKLQDNYRGPEIITFAFWLPKGVRLGKKGAQITLIAEAKGGDGKRKSFSFRFAPAEASTQLVASQNVRYEQ